MNRKEHASLFPGLQLERAPKKFAVSVLIGNLFQQIGLQLASAIPVSSDWSEQLHPDGWSEGRQRLIEVKSANRVRPWRIDCRQLELYSQCNLQGIGVEYVLICYDCKRLIDSKTELDLVNSLCGLGLEGERINPLPPILAYQIGLVEIEKIISQKGKKEHQLFGEPIFTISRSDVERVCKSARIETVTARIEDLEFETEVLVSEN